MKTYAFILIIVLGLVGCSEKEESTGGKQEISTTTTSEMTKEDNSTNEISEEESEVLNDINKDEYVEANYNELNSDSIPPDKKVILDGEITKIRLNEIGGAFEVTNKHGVYNVYNYTRQKIKEGQKVKIYGKTDGQKGENGFAKVFADLIE